MLFGHQDGGGVYVQLISQYFVSLQFISEPVQVYFLESLKHFGSKLELVISIRAHLDLHINRQYSIAYDMQQMPQADNFFRCHSCCYS